MAIFNSKLLNYQRVSGEIYSDLIVTSLVSWLIRGIIPSRGIISGAV